MKHRKGPYPSPSAPKLWAANVIPPMIATLSGEFTVSRTGVPMGALNLPCRVSDVWMSIGASGKHNTHAVSLTGDVKINGVSCLATQPVIAHVSGEASMQKTTKVTGDTGVTQSVLGTSNRVFPGDVVSCDFAVTRGGSLDIEMANAAIVVEFEPVF